MLGRSGVKKSISLVVFGTMFLGICASGADAQEEAKPLAPNDPRLDFQSPIQTGAPPLHFHVRLDKAGVITGVDVSRPGAAAPFQSLPSCEKNPDSIDTSWSDPDLSQLIGTDDLNFDGYQDLELLQFYIPHLAKRLYCVFLWNPKTGYFVFSKQLSDISVNLKVDTKAQTIHTREDWMGGAWEESSYRWNDGKLNLIERNGLYGDWGSQTKTQCGFTFTCSRLIQRKMTTTLAKPICDPGEMDNLPTCP